MKHLSHAAALLSAVVLGAGCGDRPTSPTASLVPSFSNGRSGSKHGFGFNGTVSGFPTGAVFLTGGGSYDASTASNTIPSKPFVHSGIVLEAVDASYDPPPVRKTAPVGNPLTVPLNPKPCLLPDLPFEKLGTSEA